MFICTSNIVSRSYINRSQSVMVDLNKVIGNEYEVKIAKAESKRLRRMIAEQSE